MRKSVATFVLLVLVTMSSSLRTTAVEWEEGEEAETGIKLVLPGYNFCGVGNDPLEKIKNWRKSAPKNQLDLACFYHDIVYTDSTVTAAEIREADVLLVNRAKEIYSKLSGGLFSKLKYKAEIQLVMKAIQAKMAAENKGLVNPLSLVSKDPARGEQVYNLLEQNNLPDAWGLPYSY